MFKSTPDGKTPTPVGVFPSGYEIIYEGQSIHTFLPRFSSLEFHPSNSLLCILYFSSLALLSAIRSLGYPAHQRGDGKPVTAGSTRLWLTFSNIRGDESSCPVLDPIPGKLSKCTR